MTDPLHEENLRALEELKQRYRAVLNAVAVDRSPSDTRTPPSEKIVFAKASDVEALRSEHRASVAARNFERIETSNNFEDLSRKIGSLEKRVARYHRAAEVVAVVGSVLLAVGLCALFLNL